MNETRGVKGVIAPTSQMITNPEVVTPAWRSEEVYASLTATSPSGNVTGLRGSELLSTEAVAGSSSKELSPSGLTTVVVSSNLVFRVAFKNAGDFQEVKVPVTLTVTVFNKPVLTAKKTVLSVQKGATATVNFGDLQLPPKVFGGNATVNVKVGKVPGEKNLANNRASYSVFFSISK